MFFCFIHLFTCLYWFVHVCVCVCVFGCLHLDHFLCFQIQAYPARLRGPTNSKCFLSILTKLENLRAIDLSEIPTKRWSPSRQSPAGTKCLLSYREVCSGDSGAAKWMVQNWGGHQPFVINEIYIYKCVYIYIYKCMYICIYTYAFYMLNKQISVSVHSFI